MYNYIYLVQLDNGDLIIFADYARNWGTNGITIDSNGLNYQGDDDSFDVEYGTDGQSTSYSLFWMQLMDGYPLLMKLLLMYQLQEIYNGIFGYGGAGSDRSNHD